LRVDRISDVHFAVADEINWGVWQRGCHASRR
jgi:hypothetical protein